MSYEDAIFNMAIQRLTTPCTFKGLTGVDNNTPDTLFDSNDLQLPNLANIQLPQMNLNSNIQPFNNLDYFQLYNGTDFCQEYFTHVQNIQTQINNIFAQLQIPTATQGANTSGQSQNLAGYGNYTHKITTPFNGTADDLNKHLKGKLAGKGAKLLELQNKYGISASVLAAIAICESGNGSSNAAITKNNIAGIMTPESNWKSLRVFNSIDDCLDYMAKNLKTHYANEGIVTISQVHKKYCPIGAANDPKGLNKNWGHGVNQWTNKIEQNLA